MSIPNSIKEKLEKATYLDVQNIPEEILPEDEDELKDIDVNYLGNYILAMQNTNDMTFIDIDLLANVFNNIYEYIIASFSPLIIPYYINNSFPGITSENRWKRIKDKGKILLGFIWKGDHPISILQRYKINHDYVMKDTLTLFPYLTYFLPIKDVEYLSFPVDYQIKFLVPEKEVVNYNNLDTITGNIFPEFQSEIYDHLSNTTL